VQISRELKLIETASTILQNEPNRIKYNPHGWVGPT